MITLVDNTVLSNFALVGQLELLKQLPLNPLAITNDIIIEFEAGVKSGRLPASDLSWFSIVSLTDHEFLSYEQLHLRLDAGEASCLAVAKHRQGRVFTDDRDARKIAAQLQISVSGTLGILVLLIRQKRVTLSEANTLLQQMIAKGYHSPLNNLDSLV